MKSRMLHKQKSLKDQKQSLLQHSKSKERVLKEFSHQKISEVIRKTRVRKHSQMLTDTSLHKLTDRRSHFSILEIRKLSDHLNQKKEDDDLRHILSHNLKRHNENHLYNSRKMTQADQCIQSSESAFPSVSQESIRLRQNQLSDAQNALKLKCILNNSINQ